MMNIVTDIKSWQDIRCRLANKTIGFVPTMGHLHAGHLRLCAQAKLENEVSVVSIFINPTQFNESSDFANYPRTLKEDCEKLSDVDYILAFNAEQMYHDGYEIKVTENAISHELEGHYRPGHFDGVLTVVMKLLNLVQAKHAYFGEKDFQQLLLIKKMVAALFVPTQIVGVPTVRAEDQLALSSRNSRLTPEQRMAAAHFPRLLHSNLPVEEIKQQLTSLGFKVDYISDKWQRRLAAVWLGEVRLIDNIPLGG